MIVSPTIHWLDHFEYTCLVPGCRPPSSQLLRRKYSSKQSSGLDQRSNDVLPALLVACFLCMQQRLSSTVLTYFSSVRFCFYLTSRVQDDGFTFSASCSWAALISRLGSTHMLMKHLSETPSRSCKLNCCYCFLRRTNY